MGLHGKRAGLLILGLLFAAFTSFSATGFEHFGTGLKLYEQERYSEASKEFEVALHQNPGLKIARYYLAVSYFKQKEYTKARGQLEMLLPTGYRKAWLIYYLARLDLHDGVYSSAIRRFNTLARRPEPLQDEFYYLGVAYMKEGKVAKALVPLRREIAFNPRDFRAHYLLAKVYLKLGQRQKAEHEFKESENLHQYYTKGQAELMDCHAKLSQGHVDQAWRECGLVLKTNDIDKLVAVGMLFGQFHHYEYAIQAFQKACALDPDSPEISYDLGFAYYQNKNYHLALRFLDSAIQLRPDFFEALTADGAVLYALGKRQESAKVLKKAHALRPNDREVDKLLELIKQKERGSDE